MNTSSNTTLDGVTSAASPKNQVFVGGEDATAQIAEPPEEPFKQFDYEEAIKKLKEKAWDAWIWANPRDALVYLKPAFSDDAQFVANFGLRLAPSTEGLVLVHAADETEAT